MSIIGGHRKQKVNIHSDDSLQDRLVWLINNIVTLLLTSHSDSWGQKGQRFKKKDLGNSVWIRARAQVGSSDSGTCLNFLISPWQFVP